MVDDNAGLCVGLVEGLSEAEGTTCVELEASGCSASTRGSTALSELFLPGHGQKRVLRTTSTKSAQTARASLVVIASLCLRLMQGHRLAPAGTGWHWLAPAGGWAEGVGRLVEGLFSVAVVRVELGYWGTAAPECLQKKIACPWSARHLPAGPGGQMECKLLAGESLF